MRFTLGTLRLGSIRGIELRAHWSWLVIFVFLAWSFADGAYGVRYPDWPLALRWAAAVFTVALFFLSVVAHELAHAIMARRHGLPVPAIVLFAFGGVASVSGDVRTPRAELGIAVVGPLTSAAIGLVAAACWLLLGGTPRTFLPWGPHYLRTENAAGFVFWWLATSNLVLAAFNLLPGFPLDGGRVFRAIVWAFSRDVRRATRWAGRGGSVVAWGLMLLGAATFWNGHAPGIWYVVIGFYLRSTARRSYRDLMSEIVLRDVPAREVMEPPTEPVDAAITLQALVDARIVGTRERAFLVRRDDAVVGLLTVTDVLRVPRARWSQLTVQSVMVPVERVVTIAPDTGLLEAMRLMQQHDIHQLPVLEDGRLIGMLTRGDVLGEVEHALRREEVGRMR